MAVEEQAFPRGGVSTGPSETASEPIKSNLFQQAQPKKKKTKPKSKSDTEEKIVKHRVLTGAAPHLVSLDDLSYKVLTEGMIVLGRITDISDYHLNVSLPGMISAKVPVTQISEPYSQLLQSMSESDDNVEALCPLSELFYKGQLVCAKIWQIQRTEDNKHNVLLSLDPHLVHSDWSHSAMAVKGLIVTAAVKSKEEHGYVMDCGVNGLRSFLKDENAQSYCDTFNEGRPLAVGQLVRCIVSRADASSVSSNIELSADPEDVAKRENKGNVHVDMQNLLPGMRFKLSVVEAMHNGVKVEFSNMSGYIHRNHLFGEQPGPGTTVSGRVLYVTPMVKNVFLSALPSISELVKEVPKPSQAEMNFKVGEIIDNAQVTGVGVKGLFLQLKRKKEIFRGFVPERRMGFNYKGKLTDENDEDTMMQRLRNKFPVGTSVRCRLLHFCSLIETYVCTLEKDELDEKYYVWSDINVGDVVPCVVDDIRKGGILVKVGKLNGFVPAIHSADVPLHQPALTFTPGTKVSGRVLKVDSEKHQMLITFKKSLVSSKAPIVGSYKSALIGASYMGTVVAIQSDRVYVSFFGDVRGYLVCNKDLVPEGHKFYLGQLLKCYVEKQSNKILTLSLRPPAEFKQMKVAHSTAKATNSEPQITGRSKRKSVVVGCSYNVEVTSVCSECLEVRTTDESEAFRAQGIIPILHLSDDPRMSELLLTTMKIGTAISDVWCLSNKTDEVVFSMRFSVAQFFKGHKGKKFDVVSPGWILPCTIQEIYSDRLLLECPLIPQQGSIVVPQELACEENGSIESLGLVEGQGIQAKVMWVRSKSVALSCKRSQVWDGELVTGILYLSRYLSDQRRLFEHIKEIGNPIGAYNVGGNFSGKVHEKTEWGFTLYSPSGVRGEITFFNAQKDLEIGSTVNGKVLNVDCVREHVEITLHPKICSMLNVQRTIKIEPHSRFHGVVVLVTPEFILVQLKGKGNNGNLAHIPTYLHPYSRSKLTVPQPFFGIDRKVIVQRSGNGILICLPKEVVDDRKDELKLVAKKILKAKMKETGSRYFDEVHAEDIEIKTEEEIKKEEDMIAAEDDIHIIDDISDGNNLKMRKRKISGSSDVGNTSTSPSKRNKHENDIEESSVDSDVEMVEVKEKQKKGDKIVETTAHNGTASSSDVQTIGSSEGEKPTLKSPGFMWDIDPSKFMQVLEPGKDESSSDDNSDDDEKTKKKKRKKSATERKEAARLEEERLQKVERELLDPNRQLSSCDDFDRMVLANPDSSAVWLQYMAFHLQATEIEKARAVAQRAIKSISYREEQEKLNVWLGLLNLENLYGTSESLKTTMDQALQTNEPYKIRAHMVRMYAESGKNKELESEVRLVTKKFKDTPGMWEEIGNILMSHGFAEKARSLMQQALPHQRSNKDSVSLIVQFALMEARNNNIDQAKSLMDPLLASYPQRIDLWFRYCDMLVKANQISEARDLYKRSVSQKLQARKMKALYSKFLQFEEAHGTKEDQEQVRSMAADYVKQVAGDE